MSHILKEGIKSFSEKKNTRNVVMRRSILAAE